MINELELRQQRAERAIEDPFAHQDAMDDDPRIFEDAMALLAAREAQHTPNVHVISTPRRTTA